MPRGGYFGAGKFHGWHNDGTPAAAGKLYAWLSGSSRATLKSTYTTPDLSAANANPLTLDNFGRAAVVLEPGLYEFELRDALGNVLWSVDEYSLGLDPWTVVEASTNQVLTAAQGPRIIVLMDASGGDRTVTLPTAVGIAAYEILVFKIDSSTNTVTVIPDGSETVNGLAGNIVIPSQYTGLPLVSDGAGWIRTDISVFRPILAKTGTYIVTESDHRALILCTGTFTVTLPPIAGLAGFTVDVKNVSTGTVTVDGDGSETIDGAATQVISQQYASITLVAGSTEWHIV